MDERSHADDQERKEGGRFVESVTLEDVLAVFEEVEGPVVTSSDVSEKRDITTKTAKSKLEELADQGRVQGRETAGRTVWWRVDDVGEIVTDGGEILAVEGDPNDIHLTSTDSEGAIHIHALEEITGLETVMMTGNYPTRMVLEHVETDDLMERGPLGEEKEIGLYAEHLGEFLEHCCASEWETTVGGSASDRIMEEVR